MASHIDRMRDELNELSTRINALKAFMDGRMFAKLGSHRMVLMIAQHDAMKAYRGILLLRIEAELRSHP